MLSKTVQEKQKIMEITQRLSVRQICLNCKNSFIVFFKTFTVIFMHCKSLFLSNRVGIMKRISFFSQDFKEIYYYSIYEKYMDAIIEKIRNNSQWADMVKAIQHQNTGNATKISKNLIILTKKQHVDFLRWTLQLFEHIDFQNQKYLYLSFGCSKVIIEIMSME